MTPELNERLERLGAQARYSARAVGSCVREGRGGWHSPGTVSVCDIVKGGEVIATGEGPGQLEALEKALAAVQAKPTEPAAVWRPTQVSGTGINRWDGRSQDRG